MDKTGMGLEKLKEEYGKLSKKHGLPGFKEMNEDFQIEKISEIETEMLIREVRKFVGDKLANYMKFIENIINPANAPMFIFSILKLIDSEEKKKLSETYKQMMKHEINFIELELEFNEAKEAQFIKESYKFWQSLKKDILGLMTKVRGKWDDKAETNNKGYFG